MRKPNRDRTTRPGAIALAVLLTAAAVVGSAAAATAADTKPAAHDHLKFSGMPKNITVSATSPAGAVVRYATPVVQDKAETLPVMATDLPVSCAPASGSVFAPGRTKVVCTAGGAVTEHLSRSFDVNVRPAPRPTLVLDRSRATFSPTARTASVVVTNRGPGIGPIAPVRITGHDAGAFAETDNCGRTLSPGTGCTITITYSPAATGKRHGGRQKAKLVIGHRHVELIGTSTRPPAHGKGHQRQDAGRH